MSSHESGSGSRITHWLPNWHSALKSVLIPWSTQQIWPSNCLQRGTLSHAIGVYWSNSEQGKFCRCVISLEGWISSTLHVQHELQTGVLLNSTVMTADVVYPLIIINETIKTQQATCVCVRSEKWRKNGKRERENESKTKTKRRTKSLGVCVCDFLCK